MLYQLLVDAELHLLATMKLVMEVSILSINSVISSMNDIDLKRTKANFSKLIKDECYAQSALIMIAYK